MKNKMHYFYHLDTLRFLAIFLVILFHLKIPFFKLGFIGVDLFILISGFVITHVWETKKPNFNSFILSRLRKIFPSLLAINLICFFLFFDYLSPYFLKDLSQSIFSSTLFLSNLLFFIELDYFAISSSLKPLLHTWSLSLEMQFYLIFFLFFFIISRYNKFKIYIILFTFIFSLTLSELISLYHSHLSFYFILTRIWEFLFGSLLYYLYINGRYNKILGNLIFKFLSTALLVFFIFFYDLDITFPGLNTFFILFLMSFLFFSSLKKNFFLLKFSNFIGKISYSLYLVHYPLIFYFTNIYIINNSISFYAIFLFFLIIISLSIYYFIEIPFRNISFIKNSSFIYIIISVSTLLLTISFYGHYSKGYQNYKLASIDNNFGFDYYDEYTKKINFEKTIDFNSISTFDQNQKTKVLFIGDSIAKDLFFALYTDKSLNDYQFRFIELDDICFKYLDKNFNGNIKDIDCKNNLPSFLNSTLINDSDMVFIHAGWSHITNNFADTKYLVDLIPSNKISIIGLAYFHHMSSISYEINNDKIGESDLGKFFYSRKNLEATRINKKIKRFAKINNIKYISKWNIFCDAKKNVCELATNGIPVIFDGSHFTVSGLKIISKKIREINWLR